MANISAVTGRHVWKRTLLMQGMDKVPGILCMNCRAYRFGEDPDRPLTGCLTDVDLTRAGNSRLGDYRDQEMARRKAQDEAERERDQALIRAASDPTSFERHLERQLREELG